MAIRQLPPPDAEVLIECIKVQNETAFSNFEPRAFGLKFSTIHVSWLYFLLISSCYFLFFLVTCFSLSFVRGLQKSAETACRMPSACPMPHPYNFANALAGGRARRDGDATRAAALGVGGLQRTVFRRPRWAGQRVEDHEAQQENREIMRDHEKPMEIYVKLSKSLFCVFWTESRRSFSSFTIGGQLLSEAHARWGQKQTWTHAFHFVCHSL